MDYSQYITRDPSIMGGEAVMAGTRVTLRTVLGTLAEGARAEDVVQSFPTLTLQAVYAAIAFAAASAQDDLPVPELRRAG